VEVRGLKGHNIVDKVKGGVRERDDSEAVAFTQEVDRVYERVQEKPLTICSGTEKLFEVQPKGFLDTGKNSEGIYTRLNMLQLSGIHGLKLVANWLIWRRKDIVALSVLRWALLAK
jgi:hypothetical protein